MSRAQRWGGGNKLKFEATGQASGISYDILASAVPGGNFVPNNVKLTDGGLGSINFPMRQKSSVIFEFFVPGTQQQEAVAPPGMSLSLYDFDSSKYGPEVVTVWGSAEFAPGFGHEAYYTVAQSNGAVSMSSTKKGYAKDNPSGTGNLTTAQLSKSITFAFTSTTSFQLDVDLTESDEKGGRNILFAFVHELVSTEECQAVVTDCGVGECSISDDPHIRVFDGKQISLLQADVDAGIELADFLALKGGQSSDVWLVNGKTQDGKSVKIQGRYTVQDGSTPDSKLFIKALAIGGDFLGGRTLVIRPAQDNCTWTDETGAIQNILIDQTSSFEVEGLVSAKRHTDARLVQDTSSPNPGIDVELPNGVKLLVNREKKYVNVIVTMDPLKEQDGLCGNFNGNSDDDSLEMIEERDPRVAAGESLFPTSSALL